MAASYYSFWLVPQDPDLSYFQGVINTLARRFGTVSFTPHVTLYSALVSSSVDVKQVCEALPLSEPLVLDVVNVSYGARFSKTLYVQLNQTPSLANLVNRLVSAIPDAQLPTLDPHLSVLYHRLDVATKQGLTDSISLPRSTIQFNQVQAIAAPETFETQEHVASLRFVYSRLLTTP
ncbi:MAG: hypothetical protein KTR27_19020 [Leptolyngbyaceae cyanobacterium MAG.088]|nr:hypothetical protein [Leptolyngbyaceae cyanobacterium MAG.088]